MDFKNLEGFEEIFSDGVLDPSITSPKFKDGDKRYKKLVSRVYALYEPESPEFDIVLIHGIGSDEFACWTTRQGILWPASFLPQDFPRARILTVGYAHSLWNWKSEGENDKEETADKEKETNQTGSSDATVGAKEKDSFYNFIPDAIESKLSSFWKEDNKTTSPLPDTPNAPPVDADKPPTDTVLLKETVFNSTLQDLMNNDNSIAEVSKTLDSKTHKRSSRSLQSFRRVGADIAARLCTEEVGVGKRPVVFVTHSMGGLITKQMLVSLFRIVESSPSKLLDSDASSSSDDKVKALHQASELLSSVSGVVFYGTPHFGSSLASIITGLQRYYQSLGGLTPTNVVTGLGDHNKEELILLNDQFLEVVERARTHPVSPTDPQGRLPISVLSFGETKKLHGLIQIVEPVSSNPCPNDSRFPFHLIDADHSGVNRPESKIFPSYAIFYGFLDRLQQKGCLGGTNATLWEHALVGSEDAGEVTDPGVSTEHVLSEEKWGRVMKEHYSSFLQETPKESTKPDESGLYRRYYIPSSLFLLQQEAEKSIQSLRVAQRKFFGRVVPPELDGLQSTAEDIIDFIQVTVNTLSDAEQAILASGAMNTKEVNEKFNALYEKTLTSFVVPCKVLTYWMHYTLEILVTLQMQQNERALALMDSQASNSKYASPHLTTQEIKEFQHIEAELDVLAEEWEGFRRYINVLLRPFKFARRGEEVAALEKMKADFWWKGLPGSSVLRKENVDALFFSRSIQCVMRAEMREGDCLARLTNAYVKDILSRAGQRSALGDGSPGPLSVIASGDLPVAFLLSQGLEAYVSEMSTMGISPTTIFSDASIREEMQYVFPALASASNFLLGFFVGVNIEQEKQYSLARLYFSDSLKSLRSCAFHTQQIDRAVLSSLQKQSKKWWDNSEQEKKVEESQAQRRNSRLLSSAVELLIQSFIMCTYIEEVCDLGTVSTLLKQPPPADGKKAEWSTFGGKVDSAFREAQSAYASCEKALLSGGMEDLERPFGDVAAPERELPGSSSKVGVSSLLSTGKEGSAQEGEESTLSNADDGFQKTKQKFREALSNLLDELDTSENSNDNAVSKKSTVSKKESLSTTNKSSFLSSSSSKSSSLSNFFLNSLVNAWDAVRRGGETKETPEYFAKNVLVFWWTVEDFWYYRLQQESKAAVHLLKARKAPNLSTFLADKVPLQERKKMSYYDGSHSTTKSHWMSAVGYHDVLQYWKKIFSSPHDGSELPAAEDLVQWPVPISLHRSYDRGNGLGHSLTGNFSTLRDGFSADAGHSFHAVLQSERSPRSPLYQSAAVALGWIHLHECSTSVALSTAVEANKGSYSSYQVCDTIGVRVAPAALLNLAQTATDVSALEKLPTSSLKRIQRVTTHHLRLAEDYFKEVLSHDPSNVGALCGMGRLHTLATSSSRHLKLPVLIDPFQKGGSYHDSVVGQYPQLTVAENYFETTLRTPVPTCLQSSMPTAEHMLDPIYRSYAAYWLGELHKPASWEAESVWRDFQTHTNHKEASSLQPLKEMSERYLEQSITLYPNNSWALTSLGLRCLFRSRPCPEDGTSTLTKEELEKFHLYQTTQQEKGISLLHRSSIVNSRNIWTLWGLSVFHYSSSEREKFQKELRRVFLSRLLAQRFK